MPDKEPIKTRTGRVVTGAGIEAPAEEAERGYDVNEFKTRRWLVIDLDGTLITAHSEKQCAGRPAPASAAPWCRWAQRPGPGRGGPAG
jgi:hypothetical protein